MAIHFRNKDFKEVTVESDGQPLLRFALAYGFRNIQNLVQKIKRGKSPYHFVEVMACPAGMYSTGFHRSLSRYANMDRLQTLEGFLIINFKMILKN